MTRGFRRATFLNTRSHSGVFFLAEGRDRRDAIEGDCARLLSKPLLASASEEGDIRQALDDQPASFLTPTQAGEAILRSAACDSVGRTDNCRRLLKFDEEAVNRGAADVLGRVLGRGEIHGLAGRKLHLH